MKPDETIDFPLRWAWHKISRIYNLEAQKHEFTMSIGYTLLNIDRKAGTPSTKLGPIMGMESRSLTRTLKTMENIGVIEKRPDPNDKRMVRIFLTPKGEQMRNISRATVIQFNKQMKSILTHEEEKQFFQIMSKVNNALDELEFFEK